MAFRLIFETDGDGNVRLLRKRRVDMVAPAQPVEPERHGRGVYAEVRDAREETLYQMNVSSQVDRTVEVFAPGGEVQRVDAPEQKQLIVVVVPDPPEASSLVIVRREGESVETRERGVQAESVPAQKELARVSLTDDEAS